MIIPTHAALRAISADSTVMKRFARNGVNVYDCVSHGGDVAWARGQADKRKAVLATCAAQTQARCAYASLTFFLYMLAHS